MPREPSGSASKQKGQTTRLASKQESEWTAKSFKGACPPLNSLNRIVEDEANMRIFDYGGIAPGDEGDNPTCDFHVCDIKTMTYKNLTNSLRFWDPTSPFPQAENEMQRRELPALGEAGSAFLRLENRNIMFLFGGYNGDKDQPSSELIAIDLDRLVWWVVEVRGKVENGHILARINPAMAAIGHKIYIFSGIAQYADDPEHLRSYSIAAYNPESKTWRWEVCDMPYPDIIPPDRIFEDCIPVYDGKKILLTPGRRKPDDRFRFTENNMWYYHTTHKIFQIAYASGSFPGDVFCYYVRSFDNFNHIATDDSQLQINSPRSLRPSGSRHPYRSSNNSTTASSRASSRASSQFSAPSILLCAWVRRLNTEYLVPELWRFLLSPDEHITCLNIGEKVWELDLNLTHFVVVGERMILMGQGSSGDSDDSNSDCDDDDEDAVCDTYVDIPVRQLVLNS